jgi:hypothetical protein
MSNILNPVASCGAAAVKRIEEPYSLAAFEKKLKTLPEDVRTAIIQTQPERRTPGRKLLAAQVLSIATAGRRKMALSAADRERAANLKNRLNRLERKLPSAPPMAAGVRDGDCRFVPGGPGDEPYRAQRRRRRPQ